MLGVEPIEIGLRQLAILIENLIDRQIQALIVSGDIDIKQLEIDGVGGDAQHLDLLQGSLGKWQRDLVPIEFRQHNGSPSQ